MFLWSSKSQTYLKKKRYVSCRAISRKGCANIYPIGCSLGVGRVPIFQLFFSSQFLHIQTICYQTMISYMCVLTVLMGVLVSFFFTDLSLLLATQQSTTWIKNEQLSDTNQPVIITTVFFKTNYFTILWLNPCYCWIYFIHSHFYTHQSNNTSHAICALHGWCSPRGSGAL